MKSSSNVIPIHTKRLKEYEKRTEEHSKERTEINTHLKKKDYILTLHQTGDTMLSNGDCKRQIEARRCYVVCSLEEIPEYISHMQTPFWQSPEGLSKMEIKNYPHDKKKWGIYRNIIIEPLSAELEKDYLSGSKAGFFDDWRMIRDEREIQE